MLAIQNTRLDQARSLMASGQRADALDLLRDTVTLGQEEGGLMATWKAVAELVTGGAASLVTTAGKGKPKPPGGGKGNPRPK
ncbi:MAG: hypothetical protein AB1758_13880 [Candidatus Eremiobacterota bacterium]